MFSQALPTLSGRASASSWVVITLPGGTNLSSATSTPPVIVLETPTATSFPSFASNTKLSIPTNVLFPTQAGPCIKTPCAKLTFSPTYTEYPSSNLVSFPNKRSPLLANLLSSRLLSSTVVSNPWITTPSCMLENGPIQSGVPSSPLHTAVGATRTFCPM